MTDQAKRGRKGNAAESAARAQEVIRMAAEGLPRREIAERLDISRARVHAVLKDAKKQETPQVLSAYTNVSHTLRRIKALSQLDDNEIATILSTRRESVWRWGTGRGASLDSARRLELLLRGLEIAAAGPRSSLVEKS